MQTQLCQSYYEENGYFICRNLIPLELIDNLLDLYAQQIVTSTHPFFRQNTGKYEINHLNEFGYATQSFLDIHDYKKYPKFSDTAKEIFCSEKIQDALREIAGYESFNLMQTMLFDANTETQPHQDWWYLDTVPNGYLIGVWIALEDINENAGRFYIIPKTNKNPDFHSDKPNISVSEWLERINEYVSMHQQHIMAPDLKKGDVLFFNSKTIHGSLPTINSRFSRKSLTAHYLPSRYQFGNLFTTKNYINYKIYKEVKFYRSKPDFTLMNDFKLRMKSVVYNSPILLKIMRQLYSKFISITIKQK
ncbi:MAG: phytanoyl-CoA dioxygenase family protein [Aulosira sp. ZfuVER01]|nr:phytanoyl-CoA dioxygenase family protein [Aulosira sp. ZfuVER01]MDZ7996615.1 phytanoyl-CoA dioxygenase family protein [Aulosira sp. DedVER01a]MDZ8052988.1 phytanoyl-CoA dioxygenase family protein [Aulosira sp. ZfuCHP01]